MTINFVWLCVRICVKKGVNIAWFLFRNKGTMRANDEKSGKKHISITSNEKKKRRLEKGGKVVKSEPLSQFCENYDGLCLLSFFFFAFPSRILFFLHDLCLFCRKFLVWARKTVFRRMETVMTGFDSVSVCLFAFCLGENRVRSVCAEEFDVILDFSFYFGLKAFRFEFEFVFVTFSAFFAEKVKRN